MLSRALDRMDDVVYCPRCDTVSLADTDGCAQCPKCLYAFCAECSDSWHPGSACLNLEEVRGAGTGWVAFAGRVAGAVGGGGGGEGAEVRGGVRGAGAVGRGGGKGRR